MIKVATSLRRKLTPTSSQMRKMTRASLLKEGTKVKLHIMIPLYHNQIFNNTFKAWKVQIRHHQACRTKNKAGMLPKKARLNSKLMK
jgi:hypothetical protein